MVFVLNYSFISGKRKQNSIIGVHSQGELIGYSVLIVGYGWWGDMMYSSETRRHWGVMRYPGLLFLVYFCCKIRNSPPKF